MASKAGARWSLIRLADPNSAGRLSVLALVLMAWCVAVVSPVPSFAAATSGSTASTGLDFSQAFARLESANGTLEAARAQVAQADAGRDQALAQRLPTLELDGRVTRLNAPIEADLRDFRRGLADGFERIGLMLPPELLPSAFRIQDRRFYSLGLQAVQPLYAGGRIRAGIDAARSGVAAQQAVLLRTRGELHVALLERYFGQVLAGESLAVRRRTVAALARHEQDARRLQEEGLIARAERLRASVALAEARGELDSAREQLNLARAALAALLAVDLPVETRTAIPVLPARPDRQHWQAAALAANPGLAEAEQRREQAEAGVRAARGASLPSVGLFARRELYTADLTLVDPEWAVGVQFSWPLYDGGRRSSDAAEARALVREVSHRLEAGRRDVTLLVDTQYERLIVALERHATFAATAELADESLRTQRRAFEEGFATSLDVIDAELARVRIELGALGARYEAWLALGGLHLAAGQTDRLPALIEEHRRDGSL